MFFREKMIDISNTLHFLGNRFNNSNITWAVGASVLLNQYGLKNAPNDIDIFIDINDFSKANKIMKSCAEPKKIKHNDLFATTNFCKYSLMGASVDIMAGFKINHNNGTYEYIIDSKAISQVKQINDVDIPFAALEDWYVLYLLIPNGNKKAKSIKNYLLKNGVSNPYLLNRALKGQLPKDVVGSIHGIMG